jgi:mycothiol synthase
MTPPMSKPTELPQGCTLRRPRPEDAPEIAGLMNAVDIADMGTADSSTDDVIETWALPRFQIERDAWIVVGPDRKIVGYAWLWDRKPHVEIQADSYVLPELAASGLEEALLERIEERASEHRTAAPRTEEVLIRIFSSPNGAERIAALTSRGYSKARTFCRMIIDLTSAPAEPTWPAGVRPRTFARSRDEGAADLAIQESFADHFGYVLEPHQEWIDRRTSQADFDPELWTLAWDGADVAGAILAYAQEREGHSPGLEGWVRELGVRAAWRGRGIGRALLLHTFALFARRGITHIALGVDMANETGATQLYESVGMHVAFRHDLYEKRMGPGLAT